MTLLVIGIGGLLGSNVGVRGPSFTETIGTYHTEEPALEIPTRQLDLRKKDEIEYVVDDIDPDFIVNCAAMTGVDSCEFEPEKAYAVNADAPEFLAKICAEKGIDFVQISTDYVFDGYSDQKYTEDADPNPLQVYGESKLEGEQAVKEVCPEALILRLSFVYGVHKATEQLSGFPAWVQERLMNGDETPLFTDQHITPTRAGQAAEVIISLLDKGRQGLFHVASRSCVTPFEFGEQICRRIGAPNELISPGSMGDVERPAPRPSNTCLDVTRIEEVRDERQPVLEEDLKEISETFG